MTKGLNFNFRSHARDALERAKGHLASDAPDRARYAALDLRLALEAVAYEIAQAYSKELPETVYEKWQPPSLVAALLDIDPDADKSIGLRMQREDSEESSQWLDLGVDQRIPHKMVTKFYHSLGSMLHVPTLSQMRQGRSLNDINSTKRCREISDELDRVLTSPIFAVRIGVVTSFSCTRCQNQVVRTIPQGAKDAVATCRSCRASYDVSDGDPTARARGHRIPCPTCKHERLLFEDECRPGITWSCQKCGAELSLRLSVCVRDTPSKRDNPTS